MTQPLILRKLHGWREARQMRRTGEIYGDDDTAVSPPIGDPDGSLLPLWAWIALGVCMVAVALAGAAAIAFVMAGGFSG